MLHVGELVRDTFTLQSTPPDSIPASTRMDPAASIQWCGEEGAHPESSVGIELSAEAWAEEQFREEVKTLSPDRKVWVIDVKPDSRTSHTYALLEWKQRVPDCFWGTRVQLANKTELCLIQSKQSETCPASSSQAEAPEEEIPSMARHPWPSKRWTYPLNESGPSAYDWFVFHWYVYLKNITK